MPNPNPTPGAPAAPPAGRQHFDAGEVDDIFGKGTGGFDVGAPKGNPAPAAAAPAAPAAPAPAAPAAAPAAPAPAAEPAPAGETVAEPVAGAPDAGTAPAGEGPPAPAAPATPAEPARVDAATVAAIIREVLAKPATPAAPPAPPPEPPLIQQARQVLALSPEQYKKLYDGYVTAARDGTDPDGYTKAEQLSSLRVNAPFHIHNFETLRDIQTRNEQIASETMRSQGQAAIKALDSNPETKDWRTFRATMVRLAQADEAAQSVGAEPAFATTEDLYFAAKAMHLRGKPAPLAPNVRTAKDNLTSGSPAPRGGPPVPTPAPAPAGKKEEEFLNEVFSEDKSPFKV